MLEKQPDEKPVIRRRNRKISISDIIKAALNIVERTGVEGLTMRSLARELGLSLMAAYHHVTSKEALLDLLADHLLKSIRLPESEGDLESRCREEFTAARRAFRKYPGLAAVSLTNNSMSPERVRLQKEREITFREEGVPATLIPGISLTLRLCFIGAVIHESQLDPKFRKDFERNLSNSLGVIFAGIAAVRSAAAQSARAENVATPARHRAKRRATNQ